MATQAPHDGYIAAVHAALADQDIAVEYVVLDREPLRSATLYLSIDEDDFDSPFLQAEELLMRWTEEDGWILIAPVLQENGVMTRAPWHHGFSVLPDPEEIATWAAILLSRPDLTISREDGPYRGRRDNDPGFENALLRYATSEAGAAD